ncbi:junctional adhesion molecule 2A [Chiloscyllium plagiosum]|uniref:junctional adhesion molecule 2A n=1 Tax=Chiloscyllium plagiosum TaxID=36176 RepID=UPI001CB7F046|nr:junctional adhesion molecule 2A [Chiloscyllium plagiosum]
MQKVEAFLCSFILLELFYQSRGVVITSSNKEVETHEHNSAVLPCVFNLQSTQTPRVEWKKIKGKQVTFMFFDRALTGEYKDRARMKGYSIELLRVTRDDMATYRCEVTAKDDPIVFAEKEFKLSVLVPPVVPTCKVPSSALSGSKVVLTCKESEGSPPSNYTWYKDNTILMNRPVKDSTSNKSYTVDGKTGILTFNPVQKSNSGSYHCRAQNKVASRTCSAQFMQVNDLDIGAIVITVVIIALVLSLCGLGMYYTHKKGYLGRSGSSKKKATKQTAASPVNEEFKHTKSFVI